MLLSQKFAQSKKPEHRFTIRRRYSFPQTEHGRPQVAFWECIYLLFIAKINATKYAQPDPIQSIEIVSERIELTALSKPIALYNDLISDAVSGLTTSNIDAHASTNGHMFLSALNASTRFKWTEIMGILAPLMAALCNFALVNTCI